MIDPIILNMLKSTDLGEKESKVYLAILNLGAANVSQISEVTGMKRPHTYNILDDLLAKKYVTLDINSKIKRFIATDPASIANRLENAANDFKEMLPYMQNIHNKTGKAIVTYYTGAVGAKIVFSQIKRPKEVYYATSIDKIDSYLPDEVARWSKVYLSGKAKPGGYHLLSDTPANRRYGDILLRSKQNVRFLAPNEQLEMDLVLYNGKVILTSFDKDITLTLIESKTLFESLKLIFRLAWQSANK